jgi:hypothetical protein
MESHRRDLLDTISGSADSFFGWISRILEIVTDGFSKT